MIRNAISPRFTINIADIFFGISNHPLKIDVPVLLGWPCLSLIYQTFQGTNNERPGFHRVYNHIYDTLFSRYIRIGELVSKLFRKLFFVAEASGDCFKSLRCIIVIAPSGPKTAISAVGHA